MIGDKIQFSVSLFGEGLKSRLSLSVGCQNGQQNIKLKNAKQYLKHGSRYTD